MPKTGRFSDVDTSLAKLFRCPGCGDTQLLWEIDELYHSLPWHGKVVCLRCERDHPVRDGVIDFLGAGGGGVAIITPFQRLMQFPPVVAIYEEYWRPLGYFLASSRSFKQFSLELLDWINPDVRSWILDLGCGPGLFSCPMAARSRGRVIGFDLSMPMLQKARRKAASLGVFNILFVRGSAFCLPFRNNCFDATLCSGALHLFDRPEAALMEIARTLSPSGNFVCQTTIRPKYSGGLARFLDRVIRFGFFSSADEVKKKALDAGLLIEQAHSERIIHLFRARRDRDFVID